MLKEVSEVGREGKGVGGGVGLPERVGDCWAGVCVSEGSSGSHQYFC